MKGVSGILRPDGVFISCSYGNHGQAASEITEEDMEISIYLSSGIETTETDESSIIYFNGEMTKEQKKWFFDNYDSLDKTQKKYFLDFLQDKDT